MGMLAAQSAVSELGDLAAAARPCLRPCDSHLVAMFNELIIDQSNMARAVNSIDYGMRNASLATVMVGGLAGDAPGAAVVQAASFHAGQLGMPGRLPPAPPDPHPPCCHQHACGDVGAGHGRAGFRPQRPLHHRLRYLS